MKLFNWKSNTNPPKEQETPANIETPLTNPALKEIPDHYGQVQAEADEKRMYLQAQKHNMPKSYFQQIAGTRRLLALYVSTFPYLSFATLLALLYFATGLDALISGIMGAQGYFLAIAAMVGGGLLIGINETIKSRKVPHVMRGQVNGWRIMNRDRFAVAITVFLSISGSAAGGYLLASTLLDDSKAIQAGHHQTNKQIQNTFQADSLAITADYGSEIASLTRELEKYDTGAGTKACDNCTFWKGKWVIPDKIKPRKAELVVKLSNLKQAQRNALAAAKTASQSQLQASSQSFDQQVATNHKDKTVFGWIACAVILIMEIMNLIAHWNIARIDFRLEKEGVHFGKIAAASGHTIIEVMEAKIHAANHQMQQALQQHGALNILPGNTANSQPQIPDKDPQIEPSKIGFDQPSKTQIFNPQFEASKKERETLKNWANSEGSEASGRNLFFGSKPPQNAGKKYNVDPRTLKKLEKVQAAHTQLLKKSGQLPTMVALCSKAKMSENTLRKYLKMLELETKGQAKNKS